MRLDRTTEAAIRRYNALLTLFLCIPAIEQLNKNKMAEEAETLIEATVHWLRL